jgi:hypothetical protein
MIDERGPDQAPARREKRRRAVPRLRRDARQSLEALSVLPDRAVDSGGAEPVEEPPYYIFTLTEAECTELAAGRVPDGVRESARVSLMDLATWLGGRDEEGP